MAWLTGWSYAKEISLTGQTGSGTLYQVDLDIGDSAGGDFHLEGHCTNFPQDIEVTDDDGTTLLDFFIEDITTDPIKMWIEVADDLGSNQKIWVYYGKSGASTNSNIGNVFLFGDDFPGTTLDTNKWTHNRTQGVLSIVDSIATLTTSTAGAYNEEIHSISTHSYSALRYKAKYILGSQSAAGYINSAQEYGSPQQYSTSIVQYYSNNGKAVNGNDANYEEDTTLGNTRDAFKTFEIVRQSGYSKYYEDDVLLSTLSNYQTSANREVFLAARSSPGKIECDWVVVRKYNSPEPAFASAGAEQSAPSVGNPYWYYNMLKRRNS